MNAADLDKYYPLIHKIINMFPIEHRGDLFNVCYLKLYDILEKYDDSLGTFQTFAYKRLYYACVDYVSKLGSLVLSLDEDIIFEDGSRASRSELIEDDYNTHFDYLAKDMLEAEEEKFTSIEKLIRRKYREGMSVKDIAKLLGRFTGINDTNRIYQIIRKK